LYDGHGSTRQLAEYDTDVTIADSFSYDGYGVLLQDKDNFPPNGALHVLDARLLVHVEPVIDGHGDVAFGCVTEDRDDTLPTLVAFRPAAAVNVNNGGTRCIAAFFRHGEVEFPGLIPFAVSDIR